MTGLGLPNEAWLALSKEDAIDPQQRICDPHHHYWDRPVPGAGNFRYLFDEFHADRIDSGHDVIVSVTVEAGAKMRAGLLPGTMYRASGPRELESLGETEFLNGMSAMAASGGYGPQGIGAGIVAFVDLRLGDRAGLLLDRHRAFERVKGIRNLTFWHSDPALGYSDLDIEPGILSSSEFRAGFRCLADRGLTYDATALTPQLFEVSALARDFPSVSIVLNHLGGIIGSGSYSGRRADAFQEWHIAMADLATCPNVFVKIGGMSAERGGFKLRNRDRPASSMELAELWLPYVRRCIELFGVDRCMFESNYPVEKQSVSYGVLWNAFKRMIADFSSEDRDRMLYGNAVRFYRLDLD